MHGARKASERRVDIRVHTDGRLVSQLARVVAKITYDEMHIPASTACDREWMRFAQAVFLDRDEAELARFELDGVFNRCKLQMQSALPVMRLHDAVLRVSRDESVQQ